MIGTSKIFGYSDYRLFLKEYYKERKRSAGYFTHRYFARLAGFSSPVFLKLVMDGKSNLSTLSVARLTKAMGLNDAEGAYFRTLVSFDQSKPLKLKKLYFEKLRSLNPDHVVKVLDADQYDFYNAWYNGALRELAPLCKKPSGNRGLGAMLCPPVKARNVKNALKLLTKLNLLKRKEDGGYIQSEKLITTGSNVESLAVRELLVQMSRLATVAIETMPKEDRDISGLTVGVSRETFENIKRELESLRLRVMAMVSNDKTVGRVYRLNLQLFPLSKNIPAEIGGKE